VVAAVVGGLLALGGSAFAAWTLLGVAGSGSGKAATLSSPTVSPVMSATADLKPGGTGALQLTVTNPNTVALTLTKIHTAGAVSTSSNTTNCPSSNFGIAVTDPSETIPIPAGTSTITIPGFTSLSAAAPTGCEGITDTITGLTFDFST
jgi:hypothetical protein